MDNSDRKTFAATMAALFELHNRPASDALMSVYWDALCDLTAVQFSTASARAIREIKWLPKPSEIRELAGVKSLAAQAATAWDEVRKAIDKHDYTASVDFGPLVNATVRNIGGWQGLCSAKVTDLDVWRRKEFLRVYEAFAPLPPDSLNGGYLGGAFDGPVVRIAIDGKLPPLQLEPIATSTNGQMRAVIAELVEAKS